jgi:hypothetical protein
MFGKVTKTLVFCLIPFQAVAILIVIIATTATTQNMNISLTKNTRENTSSLHDVTIRDCVVIIAHDSLVTNE